MRLTAITFALALIASMARADVFPSVEAFLNEIETYDFSADHLKLGRHLSIEEPGQPETPPRIVAPMKTDTAGILWKSGDSALLFLTSRPPTESTAAETALLLGLSHSGEGWILSDLRQFHALGKYASVRFEFTGGGHSPPPVVTVTTTNGGRGECFKASETYELKNGRLTRVHLARELDPIRPPAETRAEFERLHAAWRKESEGIGRSSRTSDYISLPAFRKIVAMGKPALPLLKQKMAADKDLDFFLAFAVVEICGWDRTDFRGGLGEQDFRDRVLARLREQESAR